VLIYSNEANGKVTGNTQVTFHDAIEGYTISPEPVGHVVYVWLLTGRQIILIVQPSYDQAVAIIEKIEREYAVGAPMVDLRFLQLHPG